jgi:hypothetical protein
LIAGTEDRESEIEEISRRIKKFEMELDLHLMQRRLSISSGEE